MARDVVPPAFAPHFPPMYPQTSFRHHVPFAQFRDELLARFEESVHPQTTADFCNRVIADWLASRAKTNLNHTISLLRAVRTSANYALEQGWLERPPSWRRLWPRGGPLVAPTCHTHGQVAELLSYLGCLRGLGDWHDARIHALAATVAYTGLRKSEALRLQASDVRPSEAMLWVVPRHRLKTIASGAPVPMAPELTSVLADWIPRSASTWVFPGARRGGPWLNGAPGYRPLDELRIAGDAVGIADLTFQSLRHTLATLLVQLWGLTLDQARLVLRHTRTQTTEGYIHPDVELLRRSMRAVSFARG